MHYENLLKKYEYIPVFEKDLQFGFKGLYRSGKIAIDKKLSTIEKGCILVEELGHHFKTVGNIIDQTKISNRKQEKVARLWGYRELLPFKSFIEAYKHGCSNRFEVADFLNVTEEFLQETLDRYIEIHGDYLLYNETVIQLNPLNIYSKDEIKSAI
ncbi:ImmA/IrrE family metallo-endopeptidase [Bacillus sp. MMSF_3328]|uniref:ImmA/IrrE family metallo-endopeptidase n=1 Tax=Bacillus sp. MMSF_3328 TaxID=3047080 RepID=UPI00273E950A|nr:ImmA/IrrE family metallo-endopeptidase [Bacillus sp. MMSF_3328]